MYQVTKLVPKCDDAEQTKFSFFIHSFSHLLSAAKREPDLVGDLEGDLEGIQEAGGGGRADPHSSFHNGFVPHKLCCETNISI